MEGALTLAISACCQRHIVRDWLPSQQCKPLMRGGCKEQLGPRREGRRAVLSCKVGAAVHRLVVCRLGEGSVEGARQQPGGQCCHWIQRVAASGMFWKALQGVRAIPAVPRASFTPMC